MQLSNVFFVKANFVTGAQIQLISKASGHSLHIVQDPSGELIVEGKGDIGPQAWNGKKNFIKIFHNHDTAHLFQLWIFFLLLFSAIWTVFNDGNNQVHLYNYNNFLGIVDGETKVIHVVSGPFDLILSTFLKVWIENFG